MANWIGCFSTIELKDNTVIVVLGASGDLAKKKTVCPTPHPRMGENIKLKITNHIHSSLLSLVSYVMVLPVPNPTAINLPAVPQQVPP